MSKLDDKIKALTEKLKQAKKAQRLKIARDKTIISKKARALDTRRKILAGAWTLKNWNGNYPPEFIAYLDEKDRVAFEKVQQEKQ